MRRVMDGRSFPSSRGRGMALVAVLWIVAALMAVTAAVGFCPPYRLLGINTCGVRR